MARAPDPARRQRPGRFASDKDIVVATPGGGDGRRLAGVPKEPVESSGVRIRQRDVPGEAWRPGVAAPGVGSRDPAPPLSTSAALARRASQPPPPGEPV